MLIVVQGGPVLVINTSMYVGELHSITELLSSHESGMNSVGIHISISISTFCSSCGWLQTESKIKEDA